VVYTRALIEIAFAAESTRRTSTRNRTFVATALWKEGKLLEGMLFLSYN